MGVPFDAPGSRVPWLEQMSYLPQQENPPSRLTGREVIHTTLALSRPEWPRKKRRDAVDRALSWVGLLPVADRTATTYSGGMRRRLGLARTLAPQPSLLLVDEPTSGLDPQERVAFRELISRLAEVSAVIVSTHITADVEVSCSRVAVLFRGRILWDGEPSQLIKRSQHGVYSIRLDKTGMDRLAAGYTVTSAIHNENEFLVRYLASPENPGPGQPCDPTLEEAYIDLITRHGAKIEELQGSSTDQGRDD